MSKGGIGKGATIERRHGETRREILETLRRSAGLTADQLAETLGVTAMKLKAGVFEPNVEARAVELCRDRMGPDFGLRIDPNGVWSVPTAIRIGL